MGITQKEEFLPWTVTQRDTPKQRDLQNTLREQDGSVFGKECFVSELADIYDSQLHLGDDTVIGARALVRSCTLHTGKNCSINTYAILQGPITLGDDVRIAPKVSMFASNHGHHDIRIPITAQPCVDLGITIGDDVWIGANAVIVDGVTIGSHSIVAAGAVVTKSFGDYVIIGGNPARVIKNRIEAFYKEPLEKFFSHVSSQIEEVVASYVQDGCYQDEHTQQAKVRAACDATEILAYFGQKPKEGTAAWISEQLTDEIEYPVLCAGYALDLLEGKVAKQFSLPVLEEWLPSLPWATNAWGAGHLVDCLGTAMYWNEKYHGQEIEKEILFSWLNKEVNSVTGLWGTDTLHQGVNGFYRLTRGTYAQFGQPLPYPEAAIDSVLQHALTAPIFTPPQGNACNVLDIIHPLWLCKQQTNHRYDEGRKWAFDWIVHITAHWIDGKGFSFELFEQDTPSLMGTEMWLAILYYLCDYVGVAHLVPYVPKGVHRI